jgi:hypothetical protein
VGGAVFIGQILVNPFVSAKSPWIGVQSGPLRRLPVELTMVNDLPVMLEASRARVRYGSDPELLLYFLDDHAYRPEPGGLWVAGEAESEIIVRTGEALDRFQVTLRTLAPNRVTLSAGADAREVEVGPGDVVVVSVPAEAVESGGAYAYLLRIATASGAVPALVDPNSRDRRHLGALIDIRGHRANPGGAG